MLFASEPCLDAILFRGWGIEVNAAFRAGRHAPRCSCGCTSGYCFPQVCTLKLVHPVAQRGWWRQLIDHLQTTTHCAEGEAVTAVEPLISTRDGAMAPGLVAAAQHARKPVICLLGYHPEARLRGKLLAISGCGSTGT